MSRWCTLLASILFITTAQAAPVILVFGDSLSAAYGLAPRQGWAYLLGQQLAPRYEVVNASISGETTAGGLSRLDNALNTHKPSIVILELGANDGLRGLPLAIARHNLATMLDKARSAHAKPMLIGMRLPPNFGPGYTRQFTQMYAELAAQYKVPILPFLFDGLADTPDNFQADGLHPTAPAQPVLRDNVYRVLKPMLH